VKASWTVPVAVPLPQFHSTVSPLLYFGIVL
jgi:hypothetical protein